MLESFVLALLRVTLAAASLLAKRKCVDWARWSSRAARKMATLGLPTTAAEALIAEIGRDAEQRIWDDLKAGLPAYEVAALAVFHALSILWSAPALRADYRTVAATDVSDAGGSHALGRVLAILLAIIGDATDGPASSGPWAVRLLAVLAAGASMLLSWVTPVSPAVTVTLSTLAICVWFVSVGVSVRRAIAKRRRLS